ncbi:MAG: alpha/beta fold hydrolase, partial [Pseudomonadota bacterium]
LRLWDDLLPRLPAGLRLVRFDKRGHGLSSVPPGPYSAEDLAGDAAALLDALGIRSCVFVGLSIGGLIAQCLATSRPDLVSALVLSNTAARLGSAELTGREVVQAIYPDLAPKGGKKVDARRAVIGLEPGQSFERAACCEPLPGERIVGITYRGKGVTVHTIDCDKLVEFDGQPDRWLDLHWQSGAHSAAYGATLE